ncbi:hypothetical protein I2488_16175 [Novosphingobium sp. 1Y9A]|uniref:Uncharacterized protein n=1 Tax=Novosphingobium jiangmenense TaxID=2791981 RepID=A0ABS0HJV8_9SPHN|nr:hypothetical protein [Novosphingobium jiangmenense]
MAISNPLTTNSQVQTARGVWLCRCGYLAAGGQGSFPMPKIYENITLDILHEDLFTIYSILSQRVELTLWLVVIPRKPGKDKCSRQNIMIRFIKSRHSLKELPSKLSIAEDGYLLQR